MNRRVALEFDWKLIGDDTNLQYPYIVSFSARPDNDFMWIEYAKDNDMVPEIDDSVFVFNQQLTMMMSKPCRYVGLLSYEEMGKLIIDEYPIGGWVLLKGSMSKYAFESFAECLQAIVRNYC